MRELTKERETDSEKELRKMLRAGVQCKVSRKT